MARTTRTRTPRPATPRGVLVCLALAGALVALAAFGRANALPRAPGDGPTTFVIVRHAEKADDGTRNPPLTDAGHERARRIGAMVRSMDVAAVVSTPYLRTEQTGAPIAEAFGLAVDSYDPRDASAALGRLAREHAGRVVVVVGHSNTVPDLVRALGADPGDEPIDDGEYDRVYLVTPIEGAAPVCHLIRS